MLRLIIFQLCVLIKSLVKTILFEFSSFLSLFLSIKTPADRWEAGLWLGQYQRVCACQWPPNREGGEVTRRTKNLPSGNGSLDSQVGLNSGATGTVRLQQMEVGVVPGAAHSLSHLLQCVVFCPEFTWRSGLASDTLSPKVAS